MSWVNSQGHHLNDDTFSTFEVRWSTKPISNNNYNQANIVIPEWFSGPKFTSYTNGIRRQSPWWCRVWTQFELPQDIIKNNSVIYFAIKDVSNINGNKGTKWPYNRNDGHNAPSTNIHTIDYHIKYSSKNVPKINDIKIQ